MNLTSGNTHKKINIKIDLKCKKYEKEEGFDFSCTLM